MKLAPVTEAEVEKVRNENARGKNARVQIRRVAIGVERPLETEAASRTGTLQWTLVEGGRASRLSVTSPEAPAVRVAVDLAGVPTDIEMVFFGSGSPDDVRPL